MPEKPISQIEYNDVFSKNDRAIEAYRAAQENRRFEIELYWKRAAYFWTFIGATFAGYFAVLTSDSDIKMDLSVSLACLGVVFSFGWFSVNRGSKKWQENWEKHVDLLEDLVTGPLYKVVLTRNDRLLALRGSFRDANGELQEIEVSSYWAVDDWLYERLERTPQLVGKVFGWNVWARTTGEQSIHLDYAIQEIAHDDWNSRYNSNW